MIVDAAMHRLGVRIRLGSTQLHPPSMFAAFGILDGVFLLPNDPLGTNSYSRRLRILMVEPGTPRRGSSGVHPLIQTRVLVWALESSWRWLRTTCWCHQRRVAAMSAKTRGGAPRPLTRRCAWAARGTPLSRHPAFGCALERWLPRRAALTDLRLNSRRTAQSRPSAPLDRQRSLMIITSCMAFASATAEIAQVRVCDSPSFMAKLKRLVAV